MSVKHVFSDWMEVEAGYGKAQEGFKPSGASPYGVTLKMHNPYVDTVNPVLLPDKPWEEWSTGGYNCVIKVDGKYKCWYKSCGRWDDWYMCLCYAESDDGIHWTKPNLGITQFRGSKDNNILDTEIKTHGFSVIYDEDAPENERYKAAFAYNYRIEGDPKIYVETAGAVSPDGLHWTRLEKSFFVGGDTHITLIKRDGRYVIYSKIRDIRYRHRRTIIRTESETFGNFPPPTFIKSNDPMDGPDVDYYVSGVMKWPGTEDVFVSLQPKYHRNVDWMELHLEMSRNGYEFRPVSREPFIAHTEWKPLNYSMYPSNGEIIDMGDGRWAFLIKCGDYSHNDTLKEREYPEGGVYAAYLREDGFVSVSADSYGSFQTQPLHPTGDRIEINCDYHTRGHVRLEVIDDKNDKPVEGFEMDSCEEIKQGMIWQDVKWKSGKTLSDLDSTRLYRIKFDLHMADIYAYKF